MVSLQILFYSHSSHSYRNQQMLLKWVKLTMERYLHCTVKRKLLEKILRDIKSFRNTVKPRMTISVALIGEGLS